MKKSFLLHNVGKSKGHYGSKDNRAQKLLDRWQELEDKFAGMVERGRGESEQARHAYACLLMMETGIRIGNEDSANGWVSENQIVAKANTTAKSDNPKLGIKAGDKIKKGQVIWQHEKFGEHVQTFGVTTLLNEHIALHNDHVELHFTGKKLVDQHLATTHPVLVTWCPTGGKQSASWLCIDKASLTKFVKRFVGSHFKPKDLRTTCVNRVFIDLFTNPPFATRFAKATKQSECRKVLRATIEETAKRIGHTKGVCKSAYLSTALYRLIYSYNPKLE
jgi:hypothetical protein